MNRVIVQVPMSRELKDKAQKEAVEQGFSSLQEVVRVMLTQLAKGNLNLGVVKFDDQSIV